MNKLQTYIASKPGGFLRDTDIPELVKLDRLFPVLVRCGGVRFQCGAQYVARMVEIVEAAGDYVRDVSFPVGSMELASDWTEEPPIQPVSSPSRVWAPGFPRKVDCVKEAGAGASGLPRPVVSRMPELRFDESQCGGVYDGLGHVTSDADSGL